VQLTRPDPDQVFSTPARIPISALPGNLGTATLRHIVFLADDQEIGTATQPPYSILWNTSAPGHPVLVARAIHTDGTFTDSPGLRIEVRDAQLTPIPVPRGSMWRYLDTGIAPPATWTTPDFDDATWPSGPARLGYGEDGEFTLLNYGPDPTRKPVTTWFRHAFELSGIPTITNLVCRLQRDDGVAVHLNGTELLRHNLRAGTLTPTVLAIADVNNEAEQLWFELPVGTTSLREGRNVLAVELHQSNPASSDLGFDLELAAYRDALPASAPRLTAAALPDGTIRIAWPAASGTAGWQLETTSVADPAGSWVPLDMTVVVVEDRMEVVLPAPSGPGAGFYRLARPTAP
jgi:hypothetical protein